jgi:hypothetical protein
MSKIETAKLLLQQLQNAANSYPPELKRIWGNPLYSGEHKKAHEAQLKQVTCARMHEAITALFGSDGGPGMLADLQQEAQQALQNARQAAFDADAAQYDSGRLGLAVALARGQVANLHGPSALAEWYGGLATGDRFMRRAAQLLYSELTAALESGRAPDGSRLGGPRDLLAWRSALAPMRDDLAGVIETPEVAAAGALADEVGELGYQARRALAGALSSEAVRGDPRFAPSGPATPADSARGLADQSNAGLLTNPGAGNSFFS